MPLLYRQGAIIHFLLENKTGLAFPCFRWPFRARNSPPLPAPKLGRLEGGVGCGAVRGIRRACSPAVPLRV